MNIQKPVKSFNFQNLSLETPVSIQGGSWITKILNNNYAKIEINLASLRFCPIEKTTSTFRDVVKI